MALQCLGRQGVGLPTANRGQEIGQMRGFQSIRPAIVRQVFDLLVLLIKEYAAGSVTGEVTAFAVDHETTISASELADRIRALRDAHVADLTNERGGLVIEQRNVGVGCLAAVVESKS